LNNPFNQDGNFEGEAYNGGMTYGQGPNQLANLNPNMGGAFLFLIIIEESI